MAAQAQALVGNIPADILQRSGAGGAKKATPTKPVAVQSVQEPPQIDVAALLKRLEMVEQQNARLVEDLAKKSAPRPVTYKVSAKGALSLYGLGMGKFPTTLYPFGWGRVIEEVKSGRLEKYLEDHKDEFSAGKED